MGDGSSRRVSGGSRAPRGNSHFAEVSRIFARFVGVGDYGRACTRAPIRHVPFRLRRAFHRPFARVPRDLSSTGGDNNNDDSDDDDGVSQEEARERDKRDARVYRYYATVRPPGPPQRRRGGGSDSGGV